MYKRTLSMMALNGPALFNAAVLSAKLGEPVAAQSYVEPLRAADPKLAKTLERILRLRMW
jgi:hypothetical protein